MANVLVLNGPNLNLLGSREPEIYGHQTLDDIMNDCRAVCDQHGAQFDHFQSNAEADIVDRIHQAKKDGVDFIVINPGAFTHTSISIRDALLGVDIPFVEVHLSNVHAREEFRQVSYLSDIAVGVITGLGAKGYAFAIEFWLK